MLDPLGRACISGTDGDSDVDLSFIGDKSVWAWGILMILFDFVLEGLNLPLESRFSLSKLFGLQAVKDVMVVNGGDEALGDVNGSAGIGDPIDDR